MAIKECKNCKSHNNGACAKKDMKVSVNATWCKYYTPNIHIGELISGDLEASTMLFQIEEEMILKPGKYAIIPIKEYEESINKHLD